MINEFSYYVPLLDVVCRTPLLMNDNSIDPDGIDFLSEETILPDGHVVYLQLLTPDKNPDFNSDYLEMEGYSVYSSKVKDVLVEPKTVKGLQLIEAIINENNEEYKGFWLANIYHTYECFDTNLSIYSSIMRGMWNGIEKIVLDKKKLSKIRLEDRLVFEASEDCAFTLYHESIVDRIRSVNPQGVVFVPIEEWHPGIAFDKFR